MAGRDGESNGRVIDLKRGGDQWGPGRRLGDLLRSRFARRILLPILLIAAALKALMWASLTYVGPSQFGIKVVRVPILGARGVHKEVYDAGFHVVLKLFDFEPM